MGRQTNKNKPRSHRSHYLCLIAYAYTSQKHRFVNKDPTFQHLTLHAPENQLEHHEIIPQSTKNLSTPPPALPNGTFFARFQKTNHLSLDPPPPPPLLPALPRQDNYRTSAVSVYFNHRVKNNKKDKPHPCHRPLPPLPIPTIFNTVIINHASVTAKPKANVCVTYSLSFSSSPGPLRGPPGPL